jgi:8-oxo-dGTP pyrophosphatase MutT (NUDIX family)
MSTAEPADATTDPWTVLDRAIVYENAWIRVEHRTVINPAGNPGVYGIVRFLKVAVGVLPIDALGRVHLVGQWRVPLEAYSWEMPEGGAEPGEPLADSARRELQEETGLTCERLVPILEMDLSNSSTDERSALFLATGLKGGPASPDETERLDHKVVPFLAALDMAITGKIRDGLTVAALLRAHHMAVSGEIEPALAALMLDLSETERSA